MDIRRQLSEILPDDRIKTRYIDLVSFASDAGFYHLVPRAVVRPASEAEIVALFRFSRAHSIPLVFRAGGTSLSGQSITDGILVDLSQFWNQVTVEAGGEQVRVQPGITGAMVNARLKKFGRKIGPDPSSINAAMMGGILSNNASGMCCGVAMNSYHTTRHISFILPDGQKFSTEQPGDYTRFEESCRPLFERLRDIRNRILADTALHGVIRKKYRTKTTIGYSLNAFVDFEHPLDILAHLLIGGEGTLAFISEAVLHTVPDYAFKSTALLYFPGIFEACQAIVPLTDAGAMMVELMDRASLRAVADLDGMPAIVRHLPEQAAALLIEFQEESAQRLQERVSGFLSGAGALSMLQPPEFTTEPAAQAFLWKVRKGLFPAVGAVRASGTTVILEDVAFPVASLGDAILDLQALFAKHAYDNAIIFGHAKDGNIHFVVTQSFNTAQEIARYDVFLREVVSLVVEKHHGTLKAEHGTGRNMAPFVETEWGQDAYDLMKQIKEVVDPQGLLNPGVIINSDRNCHIRDLKLLPPVEEEVDRCIECGYCEHRCPSRDLTTTPRRRIVIRRALANLAMEGNRANHALLLRQYQYDGLETCAVDGLCATACPVDINTGDLVKRLRRESHAAFANRVALVVARNFSGMVWLARAALKAGAAMNLLFGKRTMTRLTRAARKVLPAIPLWTPQMEAPPSLALLRANGDPASHAATTAVVYFPACITRMLGAYGDRKNGVETFFSICRKAGISVILPAQVHGTCCGQIFSSKGFTAAYAFTANTIVAQLWASTLQGKIPVVTDVSSCANTLHHLRPALSDENKHKFDSLSILDSVDFLHDIILPHASARTRKKSIVLHPVCALEKMKTGDKLIRVAKFFAEEVVVPQNAGCCGMAGDRGFLFPELTRSATCAEGAEVQATPCDGYYSSTKTCEMALSQATGRNYESILHLADEHFHPAGTREQR